MRWASSYKYVLLVCIIKYIGKLCDVSDVYTVLTVYADKAQARNPQPTGLLGCAKTRNAATRNPLQSAYWVGGLLVGSKASNPDPQRAQGRVSGRGEGTWGRRGMPLAG